MLWKPPRPPKKKLDFQIYHIYMQIHSLHVCAYIDINIFINNSYKHHFRIAQKSHSTVYHTSNILFFWRSQFILSRRCDDPTFGHSCRPPFVCMCCLWQQKSGRGPKPHWQNKNSNDTQDHFTRSSPEIEFESVGVVVTVAVVTGNSGAPLLSIFR